MVEGFTDFLRTSLRSNTNFGTNGLRVYPSLAFIVKKNEREILGRAHNLKELRNLLNNGTDAAYKFHANKQNNDFSTWIGKVLGDQKLAQKIQNSKSRKDFIKILSCPHCIY